MFGAPEGRDFDYLAIHFFYLSDLIYFCLALLRRGIAKKSLKQFENAREDFKSVLLLAPDNKRAKVYYY